MNEDEFLNFLLGQGGNLPPEQAGGALLVLINLRLSDLDVRRPKSGLLVAVPTG